MVKLRQWAIKFLVNLAEHELYATPVKPVDPDKQLRFYSNMWETPGFKEYLVDRETRIVHAQAKHWTPEQSGQRAENALLYHKTKGAFDKLHPKQPEG